MKKKVLDCTFRDGGFHNNWEFSQDFVIRTVKALHDSGVDFIELGYRGKGEKSKIVDEEVLKSYGFEDKIKNCLLYTSPSPRD